jgi:hypothetical protein
MPPGRLPEVIDQV